MSNSIAYDSKQKRLIHRLVESLFSGQEFDAFCAKHFPAIFAEFTPDSTYPERIQTAIEQLAQANQLGR
ncbi:MAG: hypothetical protein KDF65_16655 [Anaerolineae bacterium]|nr:hypothetical protein [Anaerolineae bacterium]